MSLKGATLFPDRGSYEYYQMRVSLCLFVFVIFSRLGLLSYIEFCIFLCRLVLFVSSLAKWLAGKSILSWCLSCRRVSSTKTILKSYSL